MNYQTQLFYPELSYKLQGCFFNVYNTLGFGYKEVVYQRALEEELLIKKIKFEREKSLPLKYRDKKIAEYRPDFVIDNCIIVELKALEFLPTKFITQLIYYLKGTEFKIGYLVNFGEPRLKIIRKVWSINHNKISEN